METAWQLLILFGLVGLVGLLALIDSSPTVSSPTEIADVDDNNDDTDEHWEQADLWNDDDDLFHDDIYTDPSYSWMPGNIFYTGDDD